MQLILAVCAKAAANGTEPDPAELFTSKMHVYLCSSTNRSAVSLANQQLLIRESYSTNLALLINPLLL